MFINPGKGNLNNYSDYIRNQLFEAEKQIKKEFRPFKKTFGQMYTRPTFKKFQPANIPRSRGLARVQDKFAQRYAKRDYSRGRLNLSTRGLQLKSGELKSVDVVGGLSMNTTGGLMLLNGIARGDDINQRNGREVVMKSIQIKMELYSTLTTGISQAMRWLLVYDRQTNGAAMTILQVLNSVHTNALKNLENRERFEILYDQNVMISKDQVYRDNVGFNRYKRLNHKITFNSGNAGTVADITTGSLYLIGIGSEVAGATAGSLSGNFRIRYEDK